MSQGSVAPSAGSVVDEIVLFGVRVKVDPMRKSVSMNNLSEYEPMDHNSNPNREMQRAAVEEGGDAGYASAGDVVAQPSGGSRERKRGVSWTEEEHKLFLIGLQKVGKGDWRGISRNYVKTRTPTQVASHAQKYFLRRTNINRRRRRTSLFDITTETVAAMPVEENKSHTPIQVPSPATANVNGFSVVVPFPAAIPPAIFSMQGVVDPVETSSPSQHNTAANASSAMLVCPVAAIPVAAASSSMMMDLNLDHQVPTEELPLSLSLSLSFGRDQSSASNSLLQMMPTLKTGESMITVA